MKSVMAEVESNFVVATFFGMYHDGLLLGGIVL